MGASPIRGGIRDGLRPCPYCKSKDLSIVAKGLEKRVVCNCCGSRGPGAASYHLAGVAWNGSDDASTKGVERIDA